MKIHVADRVFDSEDIVEISIRESRKEVFVSTGDDFYRIKYTSDKEIQDVIYWKKLATITHKDLHNAIYLLIITCDYFINSKEQCLGCPLHRNTGCLLMTIPNNWRE